MKSTWQRLRFTAALFIASGASSQAEITGSARIQATDGLKGVSAVFVADRLKTAVETLRTDAAGAGVVAQVAALVAFDVGQALASGIVLLTCPDAVAPRLAIAPRSGDAQDGSHVGHGEIRFAGTASDESSAATLRLIGATIVGTVLPGGLLVVPP